MGFVKNLIFYSIYESFMLQSFLYFICKSKGFPLFPFLFLIRSSFRLLIVLFVVIQKFDLLREETEVQHVEPMSLRP